MRNLFRGLGIYLAFFLLTSVSFAEISHKEFLSSNFIKSFKNQEYKKALKEANELLKTHPNDPLILRYRALTLEKLHHPAEAISLYHEILAAHPYDEPARLFLGLAYIKEGENHKAAAELHQVVKHSTLAEYRHWAQEQLDRLHAHEVSRGKSIKKKVYVVGKTGVVYDSNPLFTPDDKGLSSTERNPAALYLFELSAGYPLRLERDARVDILYIGQQYSHSHGAHQVDFTSNGFALDSKKRTFAGKRPFLLGGRYDFRANFLRSDLFSIVNRFFVSADTSFWHKTLTHFFARFAVSNYGPDGADPDQSSRDGIREAIGMTQYFYTKSRKTFFFIKGEGDFNQTRGENFNRQGVLATVGFHTPFLRLHKTDLDVSSSFNWGVYPEFTSLSSLDPEGRRDTGWDVYAGVTRHWKPNLATRVFYRFINSANSNDLLDHSRHLAGVEVIFSF
ncbi:MAG: hypothetical protein Q7K71_03060 [Candidatus Omnitrophota bacterium]|nr:hypothetical protein [Candidatus Omnitrophota bacterium]